MFSGSRRGPGLAIFMLATQIFQVGLHNIPPVTLATIAINTIIFLRIPILNIRYPSLGNVCISVVNTWYKGDWKRIALAAFFHADEWHLYYNMASMLFKGMSLEKRLGSAYFVYLLAVFTILTNGVLLGLNYATDEFLGYHEYLSHCAVGFSGVLFALKVVTTYYLPPGIQYIMGIIPIHSRLACWAELFLIQIFVPNASFTGHLAGILVGLLYVKGPLKPIMDIFIPAANSPSYTYKAQATGYRNQYQPRHQPPTGNYGNTRNLNQGEDEDLAEAIRHSQADYSAQQRAHTRWNGNPNDEEIRRRRLARYT